MKPQVVRLRYEEIAAGSTHAGGCASSCWGSSAETAQIDPERIGYSLSELATAPIGSNPCLGCGNPCAFAAIRIRIQDGSSAYLREWTPQINAADYVVSAHVQARKSA